MRAELHGAEGGAGRETGEGLGSGTGRGLPER